MQTTMLLLRPPLAVRSTSRKPILHSLPHRTVFVSTGATPLSSKHHCSSSLDFSVFISRFFALTHVAPGEKNKRWCTVARADSPQSSAPLFDADSTEKIKLGQVVRRLESTARRFKRLGSLGFWGQLVFTAVAAVILAFSAVVTGKVTSPFTFYATAGGIAAGFISAFWSFGYIRLSERLRRSANDPSKAPPRAEVVKSLKNGIVTNLLGMGSAVLGMQATVGLLVAKALTTSAVPNYQGISPGQSPVLALDVFLVQAVANTILSHFLGLLFSLELLRSVTQPLSNRVPLPKPA